MTARYARLWLVALLLLTVTLSAGALFIKHELEAVRETFLSVVKSQIGAEFSVSNVQVDGLRGFRVTDLETALALPGGPNVQVYVPEAVLRLNLIDLFNRNISIESVDVRGAVVTLDDISTWTTRPIGSGKGPSFANPFLPARFTGRDCTVHVRPGADAPIVSFTNMAIDLERRAESGWLQAEMRGVVDDMPDSAFEVSYQSNGSDEFRLRATTSAMTPDEAAVFWPAVRDHFDGGAITPTLTVDRLGETMVANVEAGFAGLSVVRQPGYVPPLSGHLQAQGNYDGDTKTLNISFAKVDGDQLQAAISGDVRFDGDVPTLDLRVDGYSGQVQPIIEALIKEPLAPYGALAFTLDDTCAVSGVITGTPDALTGTVAASVSGGTAQYAPGKAAWPAADLVLGRIEAEWDIGTKQPRVFMRVKDGNVRHGQTDSTAEDVAGMLTLEGTRLELEPLTATYRGQSVMLEGDYDMESRQGGVSFYGTIARIEDTQLHGAFKHVTLSGTAGVRGTATANGDQFAIRADVDATGTRIDYRWWFSKPAGLGLIGDVDINIDGGNALDMTAIVLAAGSEVHGDLHAEHNGEKWQLMNALLTSQEVDILTAGMCLPIGYRVMGGTLRDSSYRWERDTEAAVEKAWRGHFAGAVDEIQIRADDAEVPIRIANATFTGSVTEGDNASGSLAIDAEEGVMPPFGKKWFAPFDRDLEEYPPVDRYWTFDLNADRLDIQPWNGTSFKGNGFSTLDEFGLTNYSASVSGGTIEGMYRNNRNDNTYSAKTSWQDVPASYFLDHLKLPYVFSGPMTGEVSYSQDKDDPSTLEGSGEFTIQDGQFSADFLLTQLQEQFEGASALPPSLKFSSLDVQLAFQNDVVMTPSIVLQSDALRLDGNGQFVVGGDMDYEVKMAITPEAAERIPALRENFNISGHKLSQQNIELAFNVTGPTLSPRSEIAGIPPVHVTLVSGALEAANEALRVIDAPRKILVDLLKIGGGIVGSRRSGDGNP